MKKAKLIPKISAELLFIFEAPPFIARLAVVKFPFWKPKSINQSLKK